MNDKYYVDPAWCRDNPIQAAAEIERLQYWLDELEADHSRLRKLNIDHRELLAQLRREADAVTQTISPQGKRDRLNEYLRHPSMNKLREDYYKTAERERLARMANSAPPRPNHLKRNHYAYEAQLVATARLPDNRYTLFHRPGCANGKSWEVRFEGKSLCHLTEKHHAVIAARRHALSESRCGERVLTPDGPVTIKQLWRYTAGNADWRVERDDGIARWYDERNLKPYHDEDPFAQ